MSDNILTFKFPHRSFLPPPKKASLVAPRSTPCKEKSNIIWLEERNNQCKQFLKEKKREGNINICLEKPRELTAAALGVRLSTVVRVRKEVRDTGIYEYICTHTHTHTHTYTFDRIDKHFLLHFCHNRRFLTEDLIYAGDKNVLIVEHLLFYYFSVVISWYILFMKTTWSKIQWKCIQVRHVWNDLNNVYLIILDA